MSHRKVERQIAESDPQKISSPALGLQAMSIFYLIAVFALAKLVIN